MKIIEPKAELWKQGNDADSTDLLILSCNYIIQWKECPCMKGVRLEDVTPKLEEKAFEEIRNNK